MVHSRIYLYANSVYKCSEVKVMTIEITRVKTTLRIKIKKTKYFNIYQTCVVVFYMFIAIVGGMWSEKYFIGKSVSYIYFPVKDDNEAGILGIINFKGDIIWVVECIE